MSLIIDCAGSLGISRGGTKFSTSLLFDVGVYAAVIGLVLVAFDRLGGPSVSMPADESAADEPDRSGARRTKEGAQ